MTAPSRPLTAWDTHGRPFLRALLRDKPGPAVLAGLAVLMHAAGVTYTLDDVAAEVGVTLPAMPRADPVPAPRARPRRKVRAA